MSRGAEAMFGYTGPSRPLSSRLLLSVQERCANQSNLERQWNENAPVYVSASLFLAGLAIAEQLKPSEGFEGVRWGASVQEVLKVFPHAKAKPLEVGSP